MVGDGDPRNSGGIIISHGTKKPKQEFDGSGKNRLDSSKHGKKFNLEKTCEI